MIYTHILKPIFFRFDPETVHNIMVGFGEYIGAFPPARFLLSCVYGYRGKDASVIVDGIRYTTPVLLSAGFDYNGRLTQVLPMIGFGGEEVGSVTARRCEGNPQPRLRRLPQSKSIIVNKGLRNDGVDAVIRRLASRKKKKEFVVGVSIARTNDADACTIEEGIRDYAYSLRRLEEEQIGDYYTINISCPNAFGGEVFTTPQLLTQLLSHLSTITRSKPLYVKMPINLPWEDFKQLLDVIVRFGVDGVIIGNLNKDYGSLDVRSEAPKDYSGGLSGKPCFSLSNNFIEKTKQVYGDTLTIIGCGGIFTAEDAMEKIRRGADLVQLITGMIYNGPSLVSDIAKAYAKEKAV